MHSLKNATLHFLQVHKELKFKLVNLELYIIIMQITHN